MSEGMKLSELLGLSAAAPTLCTNGEARETTEKVYRYIIDYKQAHDGLSPTVREIADACDISSTSVVNYNLDKLEAAGKIRRAYGLSGIQVAGGRWLPPGSDAHSPGCGALGRYPGSIDNGRIDTEYTPIPPTNATTAAKLRTAGEVAEP